MVGTMPVFLERTSEVLLKEAETLHNLASRAKRLATVAADEEQKARLVRRGRDLERRAALLEQEAAER
jgi:hypothetical protein